jgi:hypothetical protein
MNFLLNFLQILIQYFALDCASEFALVLFIFFSSPLATRSVTLRFGVALLATFLVARRASPALFVDDEMDDEHIY